MMQNQEDNNRTISENVRIYCRDTHVVPARKRGEKQITIRAGDIHKELGFKNRLPLICSALGTELYNKMANVKRISIEGPVIGANTRFTFQLL